MSVINKMLRDLDKRQAVEAAKKGTSGMGALRKGTSSVGGFSDGSRPGARQTILWGGALTLAVAAGALWWMQNAPAGGPLPAQAERTAAPSVAPAATVVPQPVLPASAAVDALASVQPAVPFALPEVAAVPASMPSAPLAQIAPVVTAASAVPAVTAAAPRPPVSATPKAPPVAPTPGASAVAPPPNKTASAAALTYSTAPANPATKNAATVAAIDPIQLAQRQQQAGREALAHAQTLWTSGSRDLAIDLLQQAEAAAEHASQANPMPSNTQHLAAVVRELSRMLLAQGRATAAMDMLVRVEPQLAGEPDIWAIRANVAQRLGRHQDSLQAYTVALKSRPAEPRWLLGAAVSLAALGQTAQATEMAEKARLAGPISKEVQSYLRQMGVNLKE